MTKQFIHSSAVLIGDITLGENVSVWPNVTIRADIDKITIGKNTNIQDGVVLHPGHARPVIVGENVTVGHNAILHGCTIGNNCLIGMGAVLLDGCVIGDNCVVGAGALVPEGKVIESGKLAIGMPAKVVRDLNESEILRVSGSSAEYIELAKKHLPSLPCEK
ncbi:MAG: gamma carbonic anhydrase family protein [Elusimicrobia bacterium]|nr:gamma carbonic anhydrase family protein [Elusimicrobiota bacterium]